MAQLKPIRAELGKIHPRKRRACDCESQGNPGGSRLERRQDANPPAVDFVRPPAKGSTIACRSYKERQDPDRHKKEIYKHLDGPPCVHAPKQRDMCQRGHCGMLDWADRTKQPCEAQVFWIETAGCAQYGMS
ncbi:hypothetical protein GGTG_02959 [Gaeumannomyces tritici R3-111a-1]|uniref:Uncharacterized protein n=1 Tax=Gaeumannomyces tritici (strain R3-111a-1) TaxID=644352 RepID=J3NNV3_GAET3|nr:hypothetical protein GGTG_02959 [Gaeumannomyces tritici R3-111a-1]EJT77856.1 hypothetical protein GGTG_02959 [Gaeumannomyces tritici R3-111a-1]